MTLVSGNLRQVTGRFYNNASPIFIRNIMKRQSGNLALNNTRHLVQLAHRPHHPGSDGQGFPAFLNPPRTDLPLVVTSANVDVIANATPTECARAARKDLEMNLLKYGAILYRDFPLETYGDFAQFFHELGTNRYEPMVYKGGAGVSKAARISF